MTMIQLILFGIIIYIALYILAKLRIFTGLTNVFPVINGILLTILVVVFVIKSGLIRILAMVIGTLIAMINNFINSF